MQTFLQAVCITASLTVAADTAKLDQRIEAAHTVLHELMATPDKGIPDDIVAKATRVAVIPGFKKGAFLVGGQSTDLVLVANNKEGFQHLLHDKLKLGGDVAVAAGGVGRNSPAATSATANAALLSYSRSKGIFAGIDLTGDVANQNQEDTRAYYGNNVSHETILTGGVPTPASAQAFVRTVNQLFHHASERGRREPEPITPRSAYSRHEPDHDTALRQPPGTIPRPVPFSMQ
jgi:lipid-binding SYLF domain-containing protein